MADPPAIDIIASDAPERQRFEAHLDGQLAGILDYVVESGRIDLVHTEVAASYEGRGIGAALARFALDEARRRGLRVIATCPYVRRYLAKHPEDHDIVVGLSGG